MALADAGETEDWNFCRVCHRLIVRGSLLSVQCYQILTIGSACISSTMRLTVSIVSVRSTVPDETYGVVPVGLWA